jgi:hypothetical protein
MLGIFGIFGRSREIQRFDEALRAVGLHPRIVPDAVKLTTVKQLKEAGGGVTPESHDFEAAAELLGYCIMGPTAFIESNDEDRIGKVEARVVAAIETGRGLDARLVLLTLHAAMAHPSVVTRYNLTSE